MNFWGYMPDFLEEAEKRFPAFLDENLPKNPLKCEYLVPRLTNDLIVEGKASVKVLHCAAKWHGVTYKQDMPALQQSIREMIAPYTTLCLAGMCKNAGKTTALNALIRGARARGVSLALTSIGRDGEREDLVTGTNKPPIYLTGGTLFATARGLLPKCDATGEILDMTGIHTPLGEVAILRALSDGFVELAGPSMRDQIVSLTEQLKGFGWPQLAGRRFARGEALFDELTEALAGPGDILYATGAFTDAMALTLLRRKALPKQVAVEDGTRLLLSRENYEKLRARGVSFRVRRQNALVAVTVNPFSAYGAPYDAAAFQELVARKVDVPVVNIWEETQWN